jgi:hypothetical protein
MKTKAQVDTKYQGWTNYETWRIALEVFDGCNEIYTEEECREIVEEMIDTTIPEESLVKGWANAFTNEVNWYEISEWLKGK